jgi:hypothetical protein
MEEETMLPHHQCSPYKPRQQITSRCLTAADQGGTEDLPVLSFLVLAGILLAMSPSAAAQSRLTGQPVIETIAPGETGSTQETYRARVRDEMAEWRAKMQAFDIQAEASGKRQAIAAEVGLHSAWHSTEIEARNLQAATELNWEHTKKSYETASAGLRTAWNRVEL